MKNDSRANFVIKVNGLSEISCEPASNYTVIWCCWAQKYPHFTSIKHERTDTIYHFKENRYSQVHTANLIHQKKKKKNWTIHHGKSEISCGVPLIAPISDAPRAQRYLHSSTEWTYLRHLEENRFKYTVQINLTKSTKESRKIIYHHWTTTGWQVRNLTWKCHSLHQNRFYVCTTISPLKS